MRLSFISLFILLISTYSCGLRYTPSETREDLTQKRKDAVSNYIRDSYKDTTVSYIPLVFAQPTVIKPYQYRQLDSLYEIKYTNEKAGKFDKALEEKINIQKNVIFSSKDKIEYIEHHIYSIQARDSSFIYFADVNFGTTDTVTGFTITQTYQFPKDLLPTFRSYITRESIVYPNYGPTEEEKSFYNFFDDELNRRPTYEKNDFMVHLLVTIYMARKIRSIETKPLLQQLTLFSLEKRDYNAQTDFFNSIDGVWDGSELVKYEVSVRTPKGAYFGIFSPYFEQISLEPVQETGPPKN